MIKELSFEDKLLNSLNKKAMLLIQAEEELKSAELQIDPSVLYCMETDELLDLLKLLEPGKKI